MSSVIPTGLGNRDRTPRVQELLEEDGGAVGGEMEETSGETYCHGTGYVTPRVTDGPDPTF